MSQATFSIRMDEGLKSQFDALCSDFGMSMSTAITVFAKTVVRERRIPFEITATPVRENPGLSAMKDLRAQAKENKVSGMSLDEINREISMTRKSL